MAVERATTQPYVIEHRVGRLIEARVFGLRTRAEANAYSEALSAVVAKLPRQLSPVLCADHRPVAIYPQEVADRLVELFVTMNTRLQRVAIVVARSNATLVLQLERLVREAAFGNRRVFHAPEDAERHLSSMLDSIEAQRARAFLAEWPPSSTR